MNKVLVALVAACAVIGGVKAEIGWTAGTYDQASWQSVNNALSGIKATYTGTWYKPTETLSEDTGVLTDGSVIGGKSASDMYTAICGVSSGMTMTWELKKPADIKSFRVYTWWRDGGRSGIGIDKIEYQREGSDEWVEIANSALSYGMNNNSKPGKSYGILADTDGALIAEDVKQLKVTFGTQDNKGAGYVEFEAEEATTLEWLAGDYTPADWSPAANNLLSGRAADFSGKWYVQAGNPLSQDTATLTDGVVPGGNFEVSKICGIGNNSSLTWDLGTPSDIKEFRVFSRWSDGGRSGIGIKSLEAQYSDSEEWYRISIQSLAYQINDSKGSSLYAVVTNSTGGNIAEDVVKLRVNLGIQDNDGTGYVEFEAISGSEMKPTPAVLTCFPTELNNRSQSFSVSVSDYGRFSTSAVLRVELSTSDDFATPIVSDPLELIGEDYLNVPQSMTVSGLQPSTQYYSRLKTVNTKEVVLYSDMGCHSTLPASAIREIAYLSKDGGFDVDVVVACMDEETATVELFANGVSVGSQEISEPGNVHFDVASAAEQTTFKAVMTSGSTVVEKTVSARQGSSAMLVDDLSEHTSSATAVKVRPGDRILLPTPVASSSYKILNTSFLVCEGTNFVAVKPGIVGVECYAPNGVLALTMAVIVMPERIGEGSIYILKDNSLPMVDWCQASSWLNGDGSAATDYPHNVDDIAIIPLCTTAGKSVAYEQNITLGGLYFGRFGSHDFEVILRLVGGTSAASTMTFERSDGKPVVIQVCGNSSVADKRSYLYFSNDTRISHFRYVSDTIFDGGWDGVDSRFASARPSYLENGVHEVLSGATLTWRNIDASGTPALSTFVAPQLAGGGTVWNRSAANVRYSFLSDAFTGAIRDSSHGNQDITQTGPTFFFKLAVTNASVEVYGFVANDSGVPVPTTDGVGMVWTGVSPSTSIGPKTHSWTNWLPASGMTLVNGLFVCGSTQDPAYGEGNAEYKYTKSLDVGGGFSYIYRQATTHSNKNGHPINWLEIGGLVQRNKGTLRVDDRFRGSVVEPVSETNNVTILHGVSDHLVGGNGDPKASENYPIIPWMVAPSYRTNNKSLAFACFDGGDRLCDMATRTNRNLDEVTDAEENVYVNDQSLALTADRTVNSLWLNNASQDGAAKDFGDGKSLSVTSGGVILNGNGTEIGTQASGTGDLLLGSVAHPGYVFAESTDVSAPNGIWTKVTAPGGLVFGYTGFALLAGDQTGIDGELVVNAGTLDLGSQDGLADCRLDVPVRVLANATVKMNNVNMRGMDVYFDDIAGASGKLQLNAGETRCRRLYVRDSPEESEWSVRPQGTYGATGSGAQHIDDAHFAGTGVLRVALDRRQGFALIVR